MKKVCRKTIACMVIVYGMMVLGCVTANSAVTSNFLIPNEQIGNHAYLNVDYAEINIIYIDGMLSGIPAQKNALIVLPAGEHILHVQWVSISREYEVRGNQIGSTTKFEWTKELDEIKFDFKNGKFYTLKSELVDNSRSFSINDVPADTVANKQKLITSYSMPKESKWGYHNIDTSKQSKFDGIWEFVESTYNGKLSAPAIQAPFSFLFNGNYMQYVNEGGMGNINPIKFASLNTTGGLFEFSDNKITLYKYAVHNQKVTSQVGGQTFGWLCDENIMNKRQTEQFTYTLDGNNLIIDGYMGFKLVLRKINT